MLEGMRTLALNYLFEQLAADEISENLEEWYLNLRQREPLKLFPYLVEDSAKIECVYVIEKKADDVAVLSVQDVCLNQTGEGCAANNLPFMRPSGPQSAQVGPVIKRSYTNKAPGPSEKILETTMKYFMEVASANKAWSNYFKEILSVLTCSIICLLDNTEVEWSNAYPNMLACVVDKIGLQSNTVFLTVKTPNGKFPGEEPRYIEYLLTEKLAGERYVTGTAPAAEKQICSLCHALQVTVYSNGLKGAGINIKNPDRAGAFPGIDPAQAWKGYGLCGACADLLYVYKNHVLKKGGVKKDIIPFSARVAGERALIVPIFFTEIASGSGIELLHDVNDYVNNIEKTVEYAEDELLDILKDEKSILNLTFLWADIGQNIENITGMITSVLPSRLRALSQFNADAQEWEHRLFPKICLSGTTTDFSPNLSLTALKPLFYRPGGKKPKKAKAINSNQQLFQLKHRLAECVYHKSKLDPMRFWDELLTTARWYFMSTVEDADGYKNLLYEGSGKNGVYLTAAGWIKYVNWWVYYFRKVGVLQLATSYIEPSMEELKPYFGAESGIDTKDKAYAFLLGVLYGKVMQVQGAKGVNVGANALTWLKHLTLKGRDLLELYNKIREKNFAYEIEANEKVRELVTEVGRLGVNLGDDIQLDEVQTSYYLLLGQSMTESILPSKNKEEKK